MSPPPAEPEQVFRSNYRDDEETSSRRNTVTAADQPAEVLPGDHQAEHSGEGSKYLRWIPEPVQRTSRAVYEWSKGPQPPRIWKIRPIYPNIQTAPLKLLDRFFPKRRHKAVVLIVFYLLWVFTFALVLRKSAFTKEIPGYGSPVRLSCLARYWRNGNGCGVDGDMCRPFTNATLAFRCPANCKRVQVLNPHAVGNQEINYRPLVIGGPTSAMPATTEQQEGDVWGEEQLDSVYRGDSFICGSAIHAGFVSNVNGGCGVLQLAGTQSSFASSRRHGISSIPFDSYFPLSFSFLNGTATQCRDLRWTLFAFSLTFTVLLSLFTKSPIVFIASLFTGMFFHVALASDPPNETDSYAVVSIALGRFLPAAFCITVMYFVAFRRTLTNLEAQFEKTFLWLGGAWVGALNNYTFDKIPIERLTPHDIKQQPGAIPALITIVLALLAIALGQAWALRIEGRFLRYLAIYLTLGSCLVLLLAVPKMNVRIHHYILALLLLPGTAMQNRPSLLYQGILFGLFIHGTSRWGFDSLLQTPAELRQDGQLNSALPQILAPIINLNNLTDPLILLAPNITFNWHRPLPRYHDGVSVLVNDVERFRGFEDLKHTSFTWVRDSAYAGLPEYFRFGLMRGSGVGDYTKAGTWDANGVWIPMGPGPSKH